MRTLSIWKPCEAIIGAGRDLARSSTLTHLRGSSAQSGSQIQSIAGGSMETELKDYCEQTETEIRTHMRIISAYRHATAESVDDLREGLSALKSMASETLLGIEREQAQAINGHIGNLEKLIRSIADNAEAGSATSEQLCHRMVRRMRESELGNRRSLARTPFCLPCTLTAKGSKWLCRTRDLSSGGAKIEIAPSERVSVELRQMVELEIEEAGRLNAEVVGISGRFCHLAFRQPQPQALHTIESIGHTVAQYFDRTAARLSDLCSGNVLPNANELYGRLNAETSGLRAIRVIGFDGNTLSEHKCAQLQDAEIWPVKNSDATLDRLTVCESDMFPPMEQLMVLTIESPGGDAAQVQIVADLAFALRHGRLRPAVADTCLH